MKKKIIIGCIGIFLLLITLSIVSVVAKQSLGYRHKKLSPLFKYKISESIGEKIENFKARHINSRIYLDFSSRDQKNTEDLNRLISCSICKTNHIIWPCFTVWWGPCFK